MRNLLLFLHILTAIFAIGPLVGVATTASKGVRAGDGPAIISSARALRLYGYVSVLVAILGIGLVQPKWHAKFSYPWVWISLLLYLVALAVTLGVLAPSLRKAGAAVTAGGSSSAFVARVAAAGGVIGVLFAVIVALMVYRPGR